MISKQSVSQLSTWIYGSATFAKEKFGSNKYPIPAIEVVEHKKLFIFVLKKWVDQWREKKEYYRKQFCTFESCKCPEDKGKCGREAEWLIGGYSKQILEKLFVIRLPKIITSICARHTTYLTDYCNTLLLLRSLARNKLQEEFYGLPHLNIDYEEQAWHCGRVKVVLITQGKSLLTADKSPVGRSVSSSIRHAVTWIGQFVRLNRG